MNPRATIQRAAAFGARLIEGDRLLFGGFVLALSLRLVIMPFFSDPLNFYGFRLTTAFAEQGLNPWISIASDPAVALLNPWGYPPAYLLPTMAASALSFGNGYVFGLLVRVPLILATLATSVILFRTARELGLEVGGARALALAYMFCPFTILIDTVWGANDAIAIMFVAGGVYFAVRRTPNFELAALMLGVGIAFKIFPVVLVPLLLALAPSWALRARVFLLAAVPGALTAGPVLLLSPVEFLHTLGVFVVGDGGASATSSLTWLIRDFGHVQNPLVGRAFLVAYGALLLALSYLVARKRLTFFQASTATILALYLVAPRLNSSYFLWALPFVLTAAAIGLWPPLVRWVASLSWTPLVFHALIYNGASGVTGLFYWLLVSGAPRGQPYSVFPAGTSAVLVAAFVVMIAVSLIVLLRRASSPAGPPTPMLWGFVRRATEQAAKHASKVVAGALALCILFSALVASMHQPFLPEDFSSYVTADHRVTVTEEFRFGLVGFTYSFEGSGSFEVNYSGTGAFVTDTRGERGDASLTRLLPDKPVEVNLRFTVERLDGVKQLLLIARIPSGWLGAQLNLSPPVGGIELLYFDDTTGVLQSFGLIPPMQPIEVSMTLSPVRSAVRYNGFTAMGTGVPVEKIVLGHPEALPYGGGRASYDRLVLSWDAEPRGETPGLVVAILGGTAAALAVPVWQWRRQRN